MGRTTFLTASIVLIAALISCKKEAPLQANKPVGEAQKVQKAAPQKEEPAAPKAEEKKDKFEAYLYDPKGRRDPFLSIIEATKKEQEAEKKKRGLKPSESYDIADIKVLAIAWDKKGYYAMIELPDKKYFTLKEGMTIGLHDGKVTKINSTSVLIREFIKNYKGEVQPKDTILQLRKEEEK